jgi:phosphatidylethanolamine/phosphatidyl-N-methylethanolamine N-methyltransferase
VQSDIVAFLRSWLAAPRKVGAIAPSGEALARVMTRSIGPATGHVVELGPGTGVFTQSLLSRGVDERDLTLIEFDEEFARRLRRRFPKARVIFGDAANIGDMDLKRDSRVGAVVSGLPLLNMPAATVSSILRGSFEHLHQDGDFYQFTYACRSPIDQQILGTLELQSTFVGSTWINLPPASVYGIRRLDRPS